jgi:acyl CoA:acetate/3-ketoacid CoA transferase alpha subunit
VTPEEQFERDTFVSRGGLILAIFAGGFALGLFLFTWAYGEELWRLVQRLSS